MTPEMIAAFATGIVTILAALGSLIVSLRTAKTVEIDAKEKDAKLGAIHTMVDGRLSKALEEIVQLRAYITKTGGAGSEAAKDKISEKVNGHTE